MLNSKGILGALIVSACLWALCVMGGLYLIQVLLPFMVALDK